MSKIFFSVFFHLFLLFVSGNVDLNQLSKSELTELVEELLKKTGQENEETEKLAPTIQRVEVFTQVIFLFCSYFFYSYFNSF